MKKRIATVLLLTMVLIMGSGSITASAATKRATFYRGSSLMWTRDNVDFSYSGGKVTSSSAYQQAGWILPNISRNKGIERYSKTSTSHKWRAKNTIGAGVPTPWGDVTIYNVDCVHKLVVYGSGSWSAWAEN